VTAQIIMDHGVSWCFGTTLAPKKQCTDTKLAQPAQAMPGHSPRGLKTSDRSLWQLCPSFGAHALTRARTPSAQLGALLHHLIVFC
jgi:hypothetical protein